MRFQKSPKSGGANDAEAPDPGAPDAPAGEDPRVTAARAEFARMREEMERSMALLARRKAAAERAAAGLPPLPERDEPDAERERQRASHTLHRTRPSPPPAAVAAPIANSEPPAGEGALSPGKPLIHAVLASAALIVAALVVVALRWGGGNAPAPAPAAPNPIAPDRIAAARSVAPTPAEPVAPAAPRAPRGTESVAEGGDVDGAVETAPAAPAVLATPDDALAQAAGAADVAGSDRDEDQALAVETAAIAREAEREAAAEADSGTADSGTADSGAADSGAAAPRDIPTPRAEASGDGLAADADEAATLRDDQDTPADAASGSADRAVGLISDEAADDAAARDALADDAVPADGALETAARENAARENAASDAEPALGVADDGEAPSLAAAEPEPSLDAGAAPEPAPATDAASEPAPAALEPEDAAAPAPAPDPEPRDDSVIGPAQISEAQELLSAMGYGPDDVTGSVGPRTAIALEDFAAAFALPDAAVTPATLAAIRAQAADDHRALQSRNNPGLARVNTIRAAQRLLDAMGYAPGRADGSAGERTVAAAEDFAVATDAAFDGFNPAFVTVLEEAYDAGHLALVARNDPDAARRAVVLTAQRLLAQMGYDPGPADGEIGPRTEEAAAAFTVDRDLAALEWTPAFVAALRTAAAEGHSADDAR